MNQRCCATVLTIVVASGVRASPDDAIKELDEKFKLERQDVLVDVFTPEKPGAYPAIISLHGIGGVGEGKRYNCHEEARRLARAGYVALVPHYFGKAIPDKRNGLKNSRSCAVWVRSVAATIDYAARRPDVDPRRIGIVGFSLGSWVALSVAARDQRISAVVEHYGGVPEFDQQDWSRLPPVLILHGDADTNVRVTEAHKLDRLFTECDVRHDIHIYPGAGHGFQAADLADASRRTREFFDRYVKRELIAP
jgi:carboxymethylenebutenolidase